MKTIVIKLGGSSLQNPTTLSELSTVVRGYRARGYKVVLVHGGGPAINEELTRQNITWTFVNGQRRTTTEMMAVIDTVLAKKVNGAVVQSFINAKIPAIGLSGASDRILFCKPMNMDLGLVGDVQGVCLEAIKEAVELDANPVPVIAPIGFGEADTRFNVNADWAATKIAIALRAERLIFLTDQNGILDENKNLVRQATPDIVHGMIASGVVSGGMCTKVLAMMAALENGVAQVRVLNASASSHILKRSKIGTLLSLPKHTVAADGLRHGFAS